MVSTFRWHTVEGKNGDGKKRYKSWFVDRSIIGKYFLKSQVKQQRGKL